jgi:hypothetical protein
MHAITAECTEVKFDAMTTKTLRLCAKILSQPSYFGRSDVGEEVQLSEMYSVALSGALGRGVVAMPETRLASESVLLDCSFRSWRSVDCDSSRFM